MLSQTASAEFRRAGAIDPVLLANVRWLSRYRHPRCRREPAATALLEAFADRRPLLAGTALAGDRVAVLPVAYHLLWHRELGCDLSVLLGGASVALGAAVFVRDRAAALRLLRPSARLVLVGVAAGCSMAVVMISSGRSPRS